MLAPFTSGWQMKGGAPLIIEKGEVGFFNLGWRDFWAKPID